MFVIIDERELVTTGYAGRFGEAGVMAARFDPAGFRAWVAAAPSAEVAAVEAFLLGACPRRKEMPPLIRRRSRAPLIALNEAPSLDETLALFSAGVDDVVRKPVHVRELMARADAIRRRASRAPGTPQDEMACGDMACGDIVCGVDGEDPRIGGEAMRLPRRERRILEYLVLNARRRVTRAEIAAAVYGAALGESVAENAIESPICRLRKKLRQRLGYDPVSSQRYLGYGLRGAAD